MSGWTCVTLHADDEEDEQELQENINEAYDSGERDPPTASGYGDRTIQEHRGASHSALARTYSEEFPLADTIVVVAANDTTDSGRGTLFDVSDGSVEEIDSKEGYEGARGRDVTGYFQDEHGLNSYATWEA